MDNGHIGLGFAKRSSRGSSTALLTTLAALSASCAGDLLSSETSGVSRTLTPTADTYVRRGSSTNYGTATTLVNDRDSAGVTEQSYLRFDLSGVGTVSRAVLRVYVTNGSSNSADVFAVGNTTWPETTTNWNNRPTVDGAKLGSLTSTSSGGWYSVDVTAALADGRRALSLALVPRSTDGFDVAARETSNKPQLVLTLADADAGTTVTDSGTVATDSGTSASDSGTVATDSGTSASDSGTVATDSGTTVTDSGTPAARCRHPLTGEALAGSQIYALSGNVAGRVVQRGYETQARCIYGNGYKVDQGHIEPADAYTWSTTASGNFWQDNYHSDDNAVDVTIQYPTIENIAMYNTGQGVMLRQGTDYFAVRGVYIQHAGDDAIETDYQVGGIIDDVLVDKAFVAVAWRMSSTSASTCGPRPNNVVKISNSIFRVFPQYGIYPGWTDKPIPGYGTVFKWEKDCAYASSLELRNTIIVANQDGMSSDNLNLDANGHLTVSENNTLVWLGARPYTGRIPAGFRVVNDPNIFVNAWRAWFDRHPQIARPSAGPDMNYNLPALN